MKHKLGDQLDDIFRIIQAIDKKRRNGDDDAQALQAVIEPDNLVVDWIGDDIVFVQNVEASG